MYFLFISTRGGGVIKLVELLGAKSRLLRFIGIKRLFSISRPPKITSANVSKFAPNNSTGFLEPLCSFHFLAETTRESLQPH